MLVPVLALGVMGCGSDELINEDVSVPAALVGAYAVDDGAGNLEIVMVIAATEVAIIDPATQGNIVFSVEYTGPQYLEAAAATDAFLLFKRGDDGRDIAEITFRYDGFGSFLGDITVRAREIFFHYMTHMIPEVDITLTKVDWGTVSP